jgi:heme a synthase
MTVAVRPRQGERGSGLVRGVTWATITITLITIVSGAVVRATHSGDGCGPNWPRCEGTLVFPGTSETAQLIEFSHRAVSGLALIAVLVMGAVIFRSLRAGHPARKAALWSIGLMVVEALIGAMIVIYGWVADDRSVARQISVPLHLVNTFFLMGVLAYTAWLVQGYAVPAWRATPRLTRALLALSAALLLIAATGATTSLADTVFYAEAAVDEVPDFSDEAALIVRLRILHPIVAIAGGLLILGFTWRRLDEVDARGQGWAARFLMLGIVVQAGLGFTHIALGMPLVSTLLHLLIAQLLWIALVWVGLTLLAPPRVPAEAEAATRAARS